MAEPTAAPAVPAAPADAAPAAPAEPTFADAVAALSEVTAPPAAEPVPVPAAAPVADVPAAPAAPAEDFQVHLARLARLEQERDAAQQTAAEREREVATFREKAALADELRAAADRNPSEALAKLGFTPEQVYEIVVNGKSPDPYRTASERRLAQLEEQVKQDKLTRDREREAATQAARVDTFRRTLPDTLREHMAKDVPTLLESFKDDPTGLAQEVWDVMETSYKARGVDITVADAAKRVEAKYARMKKLWGSPVPQTPGAPSKPAPAPTSTTLTNVPPTQAAPPLDPDEMDPEARFQAALAVLTANAG